MNEFWKHYAKYKGADTKEYILHVSIYMKFYIMQDNWQWKKVY